MARKVRNAWRKLPRDVYNALADCNAKTTTGVYNHLNKTGVKPVTPLKTVRAMVKRRSTKEVPIKVSKNLFGRRDAEGVAGQWIDKTGKRGVDIRIHPIVKYYHRDHIKDVIDHELDHAKVGMRKAKRLMNKGSSYKEWQKTKAVYRERK